MRKSIHDQEMEYVDYWSKVTQIISVMFFNQEISFEDYNEAYADLEVAKELIISSSEEQWAIGTT